MALPQTIKENEVLLVLVNEETNEELHTIIDNNEEIILWSVGQDFSNDEVVAYAFESNVEIERIAAEDEEFLSDVVSDTWSGYIIRTNEELNDLVETLS